MTTSMPTRLLINACGYGIVFYLCYLYIWFLEVVCEFYGLVSPLDMDKFWLYAIFAASIGAAVLMYITSEDLDRDEDREAMKEIEENKLKGSQKCKGEHADCNDCCDNDTIE